MFLGVHCYAPVLALNGDCGWKNSIVRRKTKAVRFWNRLQLLDNNRLTKKIFLFEKHNELGWAAQMKEIFEDVGLLHAYENNETVNISNASALFHEKECQKWILEIPNFPKLRTYAIFKALFSIEPYVVKTLSRRRRSLVAKLRMGILPLAIETGRWRSLPIEERICSMCNAHEVENETHFLFYCSFYDDYRSQYLRIVENVCPEFEQKNIEEKWKIVMSETLINKTASFIESIFDARQAQIYI
jgi:hypothetical protein